MLATATTELRWGWVAAHKNHAPQLETFKTPGEALSAMCNRHAKDCEYTLEDFANHGFLLARVRVTVEPLFVMQEIAGAEGA